MPAADSAAQRRPAEHTLSSQPRPRTVAVIGAGIVGTCTALYLQREGFAVTLIERDQPGDACSHGNAGNLGVASCVPYSLPGMLWKVPKLLLDPKSPLAVKPTHMVKSMPWFLRFIRAGNAETVEEIADALRSLMARLKNAYEPLIKEAGAHNLIVSAGRLQVHESERAMKGAEYGMDIRRRRGIAFEVLTGDEVREREPALGPAIKGGYYIPEGSHCLNPSGFVKMLAESFVRNGGRLARADVRGFDLAHGPGARLVTANGLIEADAAVIAAGAWSKTLAAQLGQRVPLEAERGYHAMLPRHNVNLRIPVTASDRFITLTPMQLGLRVSGMGEFAAVDAPANYRYCRMIVAHAKTLLPGLSEDGAIDWMGPRPALPDGKPIIDRSARHPWAYFAFGHGHVGLGTGAITGRVVSQLVAGKTPEVDLAPFRADRF
jgi:D-amino-acid dehydrogenase